MREKSNIYRRPSKFGIETFNLMTHDAYNNGLSTNQNNLWILEIYFF